MKPTESRKRNSSQKPNIGTKHLGKRNSRLKSQHKLEMARRRSRVAELASEGKSARAAEEILRLEGFKHCDHVTVAADLKLECARLAQAARATTVQHQQKVLEKLTQMEAFVRVRGWDDPNYVSDLLGIIDRVIRLMGLAEERHHVDIAVETTDPKKMKLYQRFLWESRGVEEADFEPVWQLLASLAKPLGVIDSSCLPPRQDDEDETN